MTHEHDQADAEPTDRERVEQAMRARAVRRGTAPDESDHPVAEILRTRAGRST